MESAFSLSEVVAERHLIQTSSYARWLKLRRNLCVFKSSSLEAKRKWSCACMRAFSLHDPLLLEPVLFFSYSIEIAHEFVEHDSSNTMHFSAATP